jgi:hypothetical protein
MPFQNMIDWHDDLARVIEKAIDSMAIGSMIRPKP